MDAGSEGPARPDPERLQALWLESRAIQLLSVQARARAQATREQVRRGRSQRQILHDSAYARLQAKIDTMPTIEQAKGIIMGQRRCGPEEAFSWLRQVSQRTNVKLRELAAQIVEETAASTEGGNVTPISAAARRPAWRGDAGTAVAGARGSRFS